MDNGNDAGWPRAFDTIVYGGIAIGILDFLDASIFFPLYYGISFQSVWWGPASGLLGREAARAGGWSTSLLGIALHFVVAFCIAASYYLIARYIVRINRPVVFGVMFGIVAHLVMQNIVIPLSAIGPPISSDPVAVVLNNFIGHAVLVGLPVALIAAWSAQRVHVNKPPAR